MTIARLSIASFLLALNQGLEFKSDYFAALLPLRWSRSPTRWLN